MNIEQIESEIKTASIEQCLLMVCALADRVAELPVEASNLEYAVHKLRKSITVHVNEERNNKYES